MSWRTKSSSARCAPASEHRRRQRPAVRGEHRDPKHERSRAWLDGALSRGDVVGFAWIVLLSFLRLATKDGLFPRPLPAPAAIELVRAWMTHPASVVVEPTARHLDVVAGLLTTTGPGANLVNDAHLATLAVEHGAIVVSFDSDFDRFPGVRWAPPPE